jgi:spermidine synthase
MPSIEISEERGVRYLHFGSRLVQGAMRIARPWSLELEYTREMMMPLLLRPAPGWPASVLQVGLGSASVTRFLYRHRPASKITVVEILPDVIAAARQFFKLPDDPDRLRIEIGDAHDYMAATRRRFDLILVDGFDDKGRPGMLDTLPFYLNCRERLAERGMMSFNLLSHRRSVTGSVNRMRESFGDRVLVLPPSEPGNTIALASRGSPIGTALGDLRAAALELRSATGLDLRPTLERLSRSIDPL